MINASIRKSELVQVEGMKKGSGRPKLTLINVLKMDILMSNTKYNFPPGLLPRGGSKVLCLGEVPRH